MKMKKHKKIIAGVVLAAFIVLGIYLLYLQSTVEGSWTERLTKKSEYSRYLDFYPAGKDSISPDKGTFIINNKTDQEMKTGEFYALQKKTYGKWCDVKPYLDFALTAYTIPPGEYSFTVDWSEYYGELPPGTYRLIKDCSLTIDEKYHEKLEFMFACKFKIR